MRNAVLTTAFPDEARDGVFRSIVLIFAALGAAMILLHAFAAFGNPNPVAPGTNSSAAVFDIAVLVFREGLECVLVLAAITAGMSSKRLSLGKSCRCRSNSRIRCDSADVDRGRARSG